MDKNITAALIGGFFTVAAAYLVWLSSRRANKNVADADVRKWADSMVVTIQATQREMEQIRKEAHALADELREVRREAWREDSMPRFREWLSQRPNPDVVR